MAAEKIICSNVFLSSWSKTRTLLDAFFSSGFRLEQAIFKGQIVPVKTISVPISEAQTDLSKLVNEVEAGLVQVILTSQGQEKARIVPPTKKQAPWRSEKPWDPKKFGDLQSPVMDDWK